MWTPLYTGFQPNQHWKIDCMGSGHPHSAKTSSLVFQVGAASVALYILKCDISPNSGAVAMPGDVEEKFGRSA